MALEHVLLRECKAEINTGTEAVPVWVEILGLGPIELSIKKESKSVKVNSDGKWKNERITELQYNWKLKGHRLEDPATGARDPGQEAVETLNTAAGYNSTKQSRFTSPGGLTIMHQSKVECNPWAGDEDGFMTWEAEFASAGAVS